MFFPANVNIFAVLAFQAVMNKYEYLNNSSNYIKYKRHQVLSLYKSYPSFCFMIKPVIIHDIQK